MWTPWKPKFLIQIISDSQSPSQQVSIAIRYLQKNAKMAKGDNSHWYQGK